MSSSKCAHCGRELPEDHSGPCPSCGKTGRILTEVVNDRIGISDSVEYTSIREYYEKNVWLIVIVIAITVFSSLIGFVIGVFLGVTARLALGALSFILSPKALMKIKEITHGR
jgi:hypothetical protein